MFTTTVRKTVFRAAVSRGLASSAAKPSQYAAENGTALFWAIGAGVVATCYATSTTSMDPRRIPTSGDVLMLGPVKEKSTGILFPKLCNGYSLVGTGVRIKYGFVKVYAVGTYMDPTAMMAVKNQPKEMVEKALLDPLYPRTIRIVMARKLSIDKYTAAIVEAIEPRLQGEDLDK